MESDQSEDITVVFSSKWPQDNNVEMLGADEDILEEVSINKEAGIVDSQRLVELANETDKGNWQLTKMVKNWEYKQANAVRLLREELDHLSEQHQEALKKLEDEHSFTQDAPARREDVVSQGEIAVVDDSVGYWKQRALHLEKLLEASLQREKTLVEKLQESIENLERQASPVEELSQVLKRADNFLHFVLKNAPVIIGHQDKELRYRFIFNYFPSLGEQDVIGKTDMEIFSGGGVKESVDFKREVLERGIPAKREITYETELFGSKTFLMYVEPVFSKAGETIGVNYTGMEVTDQVRKKEKMAKLREEVAVQKAKEMELNKMTHITEETMHVKKMLMKMCHEIRSLLSRIVSITEIVSTTYPDKEQRQLLKVMLSSADSVLQFINDILDLSKGESRWHSTSPPAFADGAMESEEAKFRPREVVKHVLKTAAAASVQKLLTLEGNIAEDVPIEVIGDVLRIRQILTNLVRKAIKFTHEGKVGVNVYVVPEPSNITEQGLIANESGIANDSDSCEESQLNNIAR